MPRDGNPSWAMFSGKFYCHGDEMDGGGHPHMREGNVLTSLTKYKKKRIRRRRRSGKRGRG